MTGVSDIECAGCGLAPCDLPECVVGELVFERDQGEWWCQGCLNATRQMPALKGTGLDA